MKAVLLFMVVTALAVSGNEARAACQVLSSDGAKAPPRHDVIAATLAHSSPCPAAVDELKAALAGTGLKTRPSLVANRGRHNPALGSFSVFEQVVGESPITGGVGPGEVFFGHFTHAKGGEVRLDRAPVKGKLLIELIAWDAKKKLFNFYEMIGNGAGGTWFYRGDSADILRDNRFLYRDPPPGQGKFGRALRCSACHVSGGPIMKELAAPHNDWWTRERPLAFGANRPDPELRTWLTDLVDAGDFSAAVVKGIERLEKSPSYQAIKSRLSPQERLRPLFCETEINLVSDSAPLDADAKSVKIPLSFLVNPILLSSAGGVPLAKNDYVALLKSFGMRFPETKRADADHAWLSPVKGHSDLLAIRALIARGVVDLEFVADVLAIDALDPAFSPRRCGLLKLVPPAPSSAWREEFKAALAASDRPETRELLANLTDPARNREAHARAVRARAMDLAKELETEPGRQKAFLKLLRARKEVHESEISRNPLGQILEPGFRVIFPEPIAPIPADTRSDR